MAFSRTPKLILTSFSNCLSRNKFLSLRFYLFIWIAESQHDVIQMKIQSHFSSWAVCNIWNTTPAQRGISQQKLQLVGSWQNWNCKFRQMQIDILGSKVLMNNTSFNLSYSQVFLFKFSWKSKPYIM